MRELTIEQRAEVRHLVDMRATQGPVEAKYLEGLRERNPNLSDAQLRELSIFTLDLLRLIDERALLLKKAYASIENYQVWAWGASALCVILFLMATGIVRLP